MSILIPLRMAKQQKPLFTIGEPALPDYLVDREEEVEALVALLSTERIIYNVAVLGYRRIGKTSILNKVQQQLENKNFIVVNFDVKKNIASPEILFTRLNTQIFNAYVKHLSKGKRLKKKAGRTVNQIIQKIANAMTNKKLKGVSFETSASPDGKVTITPKIEFFPIDGRRKSETPDYQKIMETIFGTAKAFAEESDSRFVIMLDEFQDIVKLRHYRGLRNIIDQFRSILQERGANVSYLICGSRVHLLREFLHSGESSVFMHFKEYPINELKQPDAVRLFADYLQERSGTSKNAADSKEIKELAEEAFKIVGGHAFYLMALADSWNIKNKERLEDTFARELRDPNGALRLYEEYALSEDLQEAEGGPVLRTILQFLASHRDKNDHSLIPSTGTQVANFLNRPLQQIRSYLDELARYDLILKNEQDKTYTIRDKVLESYLEQEVDELDVSIELEK